MELALDIAIQASPDHPWVREHPEWFRHAPDGTIKYAENPPKKYQDIYPIDFGNDDPSTNGALDCLARRRPAWVERGVRIFRVDNPHTKPLAVLGWLIDDVQRDHPDVIFLSEAFTRPKMMQQLAKIGFSQSYTYFTWRETRDELREYFTELTQTADARLLPAEPVHQHAGHQPAPPGSWPACLRDPLRAGRDARRAAMGSTPAGSSARTPGSRTARSTATARSTRSVPAIGMRRATSSRCSARSTACAASSRRCS